MDCFHVSVASSSKHSTVTQDLAILGDPRLTEALGRLAIAHTHLELVLRYTVKTLRGHGVSEGLKKTKREKVWSLREKINELFLATGPTPDDQLKLNSLLARAKNLSKMRNHYLHSAWSVTEAGKALIHGEDHVWKPAPTKEEVDRLTVNIVTLAKEINYERLHGFIKKSLAAK